jgi:hypothetical protein
VRLAADGVAYFTIRGVASEPLRVVLLLGQVPATVSAAASVLERTAMGIMSVIGVGVFATLAVASNVLPHEWEQGFRVIAIVAGIVLLLTAVFLTRKGHYFGPLFERIHSRTGWKWTGGRTIHFITSVEDLFLTLARTDRGRIRTLVLLSMACYALMAFEVVVVFWAIGQSMSLWTGTIVETFTRSMSVLGGIIPGNLGALEARMSPSSKHSALPAAGRWRWCAGPQSALGHRRVGGLPARYHEEFVMLGDFLSHVQTWAAGLGGVGLLVIATLDSSFLSFPQVPDLLIIVLSTAYPDRMPYYAA